MQTPENSFYFHKDADRVFDIAKEAYCELYLHRA